VKHTLFSFCEAYIIFIESYVTCWAVFCYYLLSECYTKDLLWSVMISLKHCSAVLYNSVRNRCDLTQSMHVSLFLILIQYCVMSIKNSHNVYEYTNRQ